MVKKGDVLSNIKIFTNNIDGKAIDQIYTLAKQPVFADCKIRIMPDVHAGAGCVIGFTADLGLKVIPNIVGVDIGCGMRVVELGNIDINYAKLDAIIRKLIPSGRNVHGEENVSASKTIDLLFCKDKLNNRSWLNRSLGTLGGGNHFIEVDVDSDGNKYLVIHTGSRNVGKQVAEYYQQMAIEDCSFKQDLKAESEKLIAEYKKSGRKKEIPAALEKLKKVYTEKGYKIPKELSYLTGDHRIRYLHDMYICQVFAIDNRKKIAEIILEELGIHNAAYFETVHNYINAKSNIVRKGAVSAQAGERLLIPINMRDGCIIAVGKGNEDWNCSAPHGAGRILSRSAAKESVSLEEYQDSMHGIYTTSVGRDTLDESPMVYKPMDEILENIKDTVDVERIIKPVYNFKASE